MNSEDRRQLFPTHGACRVNPSSLKSYSNSPKNSHTFAESLAAPAKAWFSLWSSVAVAIIIITIIIIIIIIIVVVRNKW